MSLYRFIFLCLCIFFTSQLPVTAQEAEKKVIFEGTILDSKTGETLPVVVIHIKELNMWTTSNLEGAFSFKNIKPGTYTVTASCLGYKDYEMKMVLTKDVTNYKLRLEEVSLAISEVTVTAKSGGKLNSSYSINKTAIEHLQATSLTDIMQLLPGVLTFNPSLTKINQITIRDLPPITNGTAVPNTTNALGTAIIIDGAQLTNDVNMQTRSSDNNAFSTSSEGGIDTRQIPINNVESIEVISGVASAEYGDLTSGAVIVRTKAGRAPLEVGFKTDPNIKQVSATKGFALGGNKGFFNANMDYSYSNKDNRSPATTFNRITLGLGYSNTFNKERTPLSFNAKFNGHMTLDKQKEDPDMKQERLYKAEDKQASLNLYGNWMLNKSWITNLKYTVAGSYGKQYNYEKKWNSGSMQPTTSATESGPNVGTFLPAQYFSTFWVEGKPYTAQAKLVANLSGKYGAVYNSALVGAEWRVKGNNGDGKQYGQYQPASGLRPRSFKDIPAIHEYSFFAENKLTIPLSKQQSFELSTGVRLSNISTDAADYDVMVDPRFNGRLVLYDQKWKKSGLQHLSIRGGWGIQHKMPTMYYLYPDPRYTDRIAFQYINGDTTLAVYHTQVTPTDNPDLKTPISRNTEFGVDVNLFGIRASMVYYRENLKDAFSTSKQVIPFHWTRFKNLDIVTKPEYINGEIVYDGGKTVESYQDSIFISYDSPSNGNRIKKWGIEYTLDFGMIPAIRTSLIANGAYRYEKRTDQSPLMRDKSTTYYDYAGIYAGTDNGVDNGRIAQRFNTNLQIITHIPKLRFIVSLTMQCVWVDNSKRTFSYNGKNMIYMKDEAGNIVPGNPNKDSQHYKYINPTHYMDLAGNIREFTDEHAKMPEFQNLILSSKPKYLLQDNLDPYFMMNLHLTKEIGKHTTFSFYVNNLTNSSPKRYYRSTGQYQRMNSDISFGAELKLKF